MTAPTSSKPLPEITPVPAPAGTAQHDEQALDEALSESFPSSDPVAVNVEHIEPKTGK
jgi:hypothetical protein